MCRFVLVQQVASGLLAAGKVGRGVELCDGLLVQGVDWREAIHRKAADHHASHLHVELPDSRVVAPRRATPWEWRPGRT